MTNCVFDFFQKPFLFSSMAHVMCYCFLMFYSFQDEREAREMVKREQDEAYRLSLEADRKKVQ